MFERFTETARHVVVQAQDDARRLGHSYIGCEHLLLAADATGEPASAVLGDQGVTPELIEAEILRTIGRGQTADLLGGLDTPSGGTVSLAGRALNQLNEADRGLVRNRAAGAQLVPVRNVGGGFRPDATRLGTSAEQPAGEQQTTPGAAGTAHL